MPVVFSPHAKFQLRKRHISRRLIKDAINNPSETITSYKNRRLRRKVIGGKILQVVTITEGSKITIISGYYLRKKKI